jgi:hypothetical protein
MAVGTVTQLHVNHYAGDQKMTYCSVIPTSGANYATGGVPVTAAALGLSFIRYALADSITTATTVGPGTVAAIPQTDGSILLKCGVAACNAENAGNADLSGTLVHVTSFGY